MLREKDLALISYWPRFMDDMDNMDTMDEHELIRRRHYFLGSWFEVRQLASEFDLDGGAFLIG